jgi:hypothetical protein
MSSRYTCTAAAIKARWPNQRAELARQQTERLAIDGKLGRLRPIAEVGRDKSGKIAWLYLCDCGALVNKGIYKVIQGNTRSCSKSCGKTKHGFARHPLYKTWKGMQARCYDKSNKAYSKYGGRGIIICTRWLKSFASFVSDMGPRPDGMSIERLDNNGNYEPKNCVWATPKQQQRNRSVSIFVEYEGKRITLGELAEVLSIPYTALIQRYRKGRRGSKLFAP